MTELIEIEKPDLVVVTGDIVTGIKYVERGEKPGWYAEQFVKFTKPFYEANVFWATTAGNHDDEADLSRK